MAINNTLPGLIPLPSKTGGSTTQQANIGINKPLIPNPGGGYFPATPTGSSTTSTSIPMKGLIPAPSSLSSSSGSTGVLPGLVSRNAVPGQNFSQYEASQGFPQSSGGLPGLTGQTSSTYSNPSQNGNNSSTDLNSYNTPTNNAQTGGAIVPPSTNGTYPGLVPSNATPQDPNANPYTAQAPTYPGLVGSLATTASQPSQAFTDAQGQAKQALSDLTTSRQNEANSLASNYSNPIPLEFQQGRGQVLQNQYLSQQDAYAQQYAGATAQENAATGQQSAQQSGLGAAAGFSAPVAQYGALTSPVTGQAISGGGSNGVLPAQAQSFISNLSQQIKNGQMTRAQAESELSAYGPAGLQALNSALGPNFNTNASNASAGTTAVGQQIQTAAVSTNKALDTLSSAFSSLPGFETGGVPATNSIANWIASQFGSSALTQYKTNLADARSQLIGVLNSSGGTPTGNEATANQYLPDNMTKAQFDQNVGTAQSPGIVRQLIQQKVGSFTQSGQQNGSTNSTTGDIYSF